MVQPCNLTYMVKLWCKICKKHIKSIDRDDKIKGVKNQHVRSWDKVNLSYIIDNYQL